MSRDSIQLDERLYRYLLDVSLREPPVLARLRTETEQLGEVARYQIRPEQGQFMALLVELMKAHHILEVGTFTGYSSLACALAQDPGGTLVTCDANEEWTALARRYWQEAGVDHRIDLRMGLALDSLDGLLDEGRADHFDFMFIDADKESYDDYYERGLKLVRSGGLILFDNTLWSGRVADPADQEKATRNIRRMNDKLHGDARISLSLVPIGDGLTLCRRRP